MPVPRETAVLFADVTGSTRLYETAGDAAAMQAIRNCLNTLRETADSSAGRVVKTLGDAVLVLFASPTDAAIAATKMHLAMEAMAPLGGIRFGVRIAFQWGPVIQEQNDVFGDTVNLAFRIGEQARAGQILTTAETAARLAPIVRASARRLHPVQVKGKAAPIELWELVWRQSPDVTDLASTTTSFARRAANRLVLRYKGTEVVRRRATETIVIGRDMDCDIVVSDPKASRQHCTIEKRLDRYMLQDHSTNGTFVTPEGELEIVLHREPFTLRRRGWITFGHRLPADGSELGEALEFLCE
jgi:class 3 adenylate cyclase